MALHYENVKSIVHAACDKKLKSDIIHRDDLEEVLTDVLFRFISSDSIKQHLKDSIK